MPFDDTYHVSHPTQSDLFSDSQIIPKRMKPDMTIVALIRIVSCKTRYTLLLRAVVLPALQHAARRSAIGKWEYRMLGTLALDAGCAGYLWHPSA